MDELVGEKLSNFIICSSQLKKGSKKMFPSFTLKTICTFFFFFDQSLSRPGSKAKQTSLGMTMKKQGSWSYQPVNPGPPGQDQVVTQKQILQEVWCRAVAAGYRLKADEFHPLW
ncbi:MAG TPA: hypothetical protein VJ873_11160 [bacterium]|nr:hypothetical protein [bacterium]